MRYEEFKKHIYDNVYQNSSNGYVMTKSELANEMVAKIPYSVIQSSSSTFLDPICKNGTFLWEVVEVLYAEGHPVSNIQSRVFTVDTYSSSANIAEYAIRKILNKESGAFVFNTRIEFVEKYYNRLISFVSKGKFKTLDGFLNTIILDKKDKNLMAIIKNNISEFISQYEKVSKLESKLFGEVFTPRQLIEEMLDKLPEDVWKNPDLKWLDPAVGIGNFPAVVLERLMVGLEDVISDEDDRRRHILEEMLYFCDISIKNLFLLYMLFDKNNEFKLNVYRGSFLTKDFDKHMKEVWGVVKFDVTIGNPPYNENGGVGGGQGGASGLWKKFIYKSIEISDNILLVTPNLWLGNTKDFARVKSLANINYVNLNECNRHFDVGAKLCYFVLSKEHKQDCTLITNSFSDVIDIDSFDYIPLSSDFDIKESKSILDKIFRNGTFEFNNGDNRSINTDLYTDGGQYISFYSSDPSRKSLACAEQIKGSNRMKVVSAFINDFDGDNVDHFTDINFEKGVGKQAGYYEVESEAHGRNLVKFLKSDIVKFINNNFRKGRYANAVLERIPMIDLSVDTTDYYSLFDFTEEEIEFVKSCIKKITKG